VFELFPFPLIPILVFLCGPRMACSFADCAAQTGPGQTERFYHADKRLLSGRMFVIIGRC
jgi:hypothetical protein